MDYVIQSWLSKPTLNWDAVLNMTKVEPYLILDPGIIIFCEKSMSGGVSYISNRYSKASNKYLKSHDPKHDSYNIRNVNICCLTFLIKKCICFIMKTCNFT